MLHDLRQYFSLTWQLLLTYFAHYKVIERGTPMEKIVEAEEEEEFRNNWFQ